MSKRITRSTVELVNLYPDQFHDDTVNAHVKQTITTVYESQRGPFVTSDSQEFKSDRYAFVPVPASWTPEQVAEKVKNGTIVRHFGCLPESVMSDNQKARLASLSGAEREELYGKILNNITSVDADSGEVIQYQGRYDSYGRNEFVLGSAEDVDLRNRDVATIETMDAEPVFTAEKDAPVEVAS